jgi:hypothetical protein
MFLINSSAGDLPFNYERLRLYSLADGKLISDNFLNVVIGGSSSVAYSEKVFVCLLISSSY